MLILRIIGLLLLSLSFFVQANHEERQTTVVVDVAGTIYVAKASENIEFKETNTHIMKANMDWQIYWTLKQPLEIEYTCVNVDPNIDMCAKIRMEVEDLGGSGSQMLELSPANPKIAISKRTRYQSQPWNMVAYLNTSGLPDGNIQSTGQLVLSSKI